MGKVSNMNKVDLNEPSIKTVVHTNSDVHIVILLTLDKEAECLKYDTKSTYNF